jgi:hypothetical protein
MTGEVAPRDNGAQAAPRDSGAQAAPRSELRASHQDRDRVVELLRVAAGDGRLTAEELDERLEAALTARTYGELASLTRDLPEDAALEAGPVTPRELMRIDCGSGSTKRDGRWLVPKRMEVRLSSGAVTLDFTQAVVAAPVLDIDAQVRSGSLRLVTRPGIVVDTGDVAVRSGSVKVRSPWPAQTPVLLRIRVSGTVSSGSITARPPRPPRRTFWQWLRRVPRPRAPYELPGP